MQISPPPGPATLAANDAIHADFRLPCPHRRAGMAPPQPDFQAEVDAETGDSRAAA